MKFIVLNGDYDSTRAAAKQLGGKTVSMKDQIVEHLWQALGLSPGKFPIEGVQLKDTNLRKLFGMLEEVVAVSNYSGKVVSTPHEAISYFVAVGTKELGPGWLASRFIRRADDGVYVVLDADAADVERLQKSADVLAVVAVAQEKPEGDGLWLKAKEDGTVSAKDAKALTARLKEVLYQ
jgi:hypothetical protein